MVLPTYVPPPGATKPTRLIALDLVDKIPDLDTKRICEKSLRDAPDIVTCVKAFHKLYGMPILRPNQAKDDFSHIPVERLAMRFALIEEEYKELCEAMDFKVEFKYSFMDENEEWVEASSLQDAITNTEYRDIGEVADACEDLKYVITGFELEFGIDPHAVLQEVQASNMTKNGPNGKPLLRADGKVLKGPDWVEADGLAALRAHGLRFGRAFTLTTKDKGD
jgi:predicted HAD superfamily Cof-like phosphohydrolase